MKRAIALLLSLVLLACLLPTTALAAAKPIPSASVTIAAPLEGRGPDWYGILSNPDQFSVFEIYYNVMNSDGSYGSPLWDDDLFERGQRIRVRIQLDPASGWTFTNSTKLTINGKTAVLDGIDSESGSGFYHADFTVETPFTDVKADAWYANAVRFCFENNLMAGTGDGITFSPKKSFSRAMFVTVLAAFEWADLDSCTGSHFSDVKPGKWYAKAVEWAYLNGYATGTGDGKFSPNTPVTRETMAVFFFNFFIQKGWDASERADLSAYPDGSQVSSWARDAMAWAVSAGIIGGVKEGETVWLKPKKTASRAEVAQIVMSFWFYVNA
jgi:hypothetical protein